MVPFLHVQALGRLCRPEILLSPGRGAALHTTATLEKNRAGRYRVTRNHSRPLTYEMANPPHQIAHRKAWNSWNTTHFASTKTKKCPTNAAMKVAMNKKKTVTDLMQLRQ
ncbi:hypothetical protein V5799_008473 [Amblyomma americanum]|uniref:Uncharacterized protein n=1 Tax=Amblyomma americanum TaxID=6943 RepID=A0AAQ4FES0_AMBAM